MDHQTTFRTNNIIETYNQSQIQMGDEINKS
jgi:hypothetical protein